MIKSTENLASKGYVVVAIDHTESTHADKASFSSTLLNRTLDINFVLEQMSQKSAPQEESFLSGLLNADRTAVIGYSMGGYGALLAAGAGVSPEAVVNDWVPGSKLDMLQAGNSDYTSRLDDRIKAIVLFAPWGGHRGVWDKEGLKWKGFKKWTAVGLELHHSQP